MILKRMVISSRPNRGNNQDKGFDPVSDHLFRGKSETEGSLYGFSLITGIIKS
jgi:hypothetical protein